MLSAEAVQEIRDKVDSTFLPMTLRKMVHDLLRDNDELRAKVKCFVPQDKESASDG